ncbi:hypothetical protein ACNOYE_03155 [Nannocystaceae bacterium ST9]
MSATPPDRLLRDVLWVCGSRRYPSRTAFDAAVRDYEMRILQTAERWQPDELVLPVPRVDVQFMVWRGEEQVEPRLRLEASEPRGFTALDLLHQIHEGIAAWLDEHQANLYDHCFFEGLSRSGQPSEVPLYFVNFGS